MAAPTSHQSRSPDDRSAAHARSAALPSAELRFRVMGTLAHLVVTGSERTAPTAPTGHTTPAALIVGARRRLEQLEARWSRFRPDSEISRLNDSAGRWVEVSADTVRLVRSAVEGWRLTAGRFDPTVLGPLVRAGYTHDLDALRRGHPGRSGVAPVAVGLGMGAGGIELGRGAVRLPAGVGFDAGGIGKGLAADVVHAELMAQGATGACVNIGGDLRVGGSAPHGSGWTIAVEHVGERKPVCLLGLHDGAVATSTTRKRVWAGPDGRTRHHLIDPFTGEPSDSDVVTATVVAAQAWAAEVLAKAALLRGAAHAFDVLPAGIEGLCIDRDGVIHSSRGLPRYLGDQPLAATLPPTTWESW